MPWSEIGAYALAMAVYPGAVTLAVVGAAVESVATWALAPARGGPLSALSGLLSALRSSVAGLRLPLLATIAAFMVLLAAVQISAPFNPVPPLDRNLLVAGLALVAAGWVTACWGWERLEFDPAFMVLVNCVWMVGLLAPTVATQSLRPEVLGSVVLPALAPVKVASAIVYLVCLPPLLQLVPEGAPQGIPGAVRRRSEGEEAGFRVLRLLLWLPYCGLFTSVFFAPAPADLQGVIRFLLLSLAAGALALGLAANLIHRGAVFTRRRYGFVLAFMGVATIVLAAITAVIQEPNIV